ncbi:PAS domain-containing sensor histidine kinase [Rufibacter hautae]|uniref:histidine kinase n=1 Tax=Rufibacter hautae TaxID=2595005 RepID=A0A5B6TEA7_9BACT|nr:PAS domain-containing sensor histidine kinase [Rufibacter hautae]KAA3437512.1 PAS domain-containing protein [Rufibacter hautae]
MINSHEFCKALLEQTGLSLFGYDTGSHKFVYLSPAFKEIFKFQEDQSDIAALLSKVHPDDQEHVIKNLTEAQEPGICPEIEFRIRFTGQSEQWVCLRPTLLEQSTGERLIIGHAEDISIRRQYNDNLKKYSNKKNSVLNILSHDLAGPMGMIHNLAEILVEQLGDRADEDALEIIQLIDKSSQNGTRLIQEFMKKEFLESAQTEVITRRVNLVEKFREAIVEYQRAEGKVLHVQVDFTPAQEEVYAQIDDIKFLQAISNLISNALKFTPDGGSITVGLEEKNDQILITVSDTGVGIPKKYHATLFDEFTKARRPGLKGEPSVGLGMSIIKTIVEWHHGQISFESAEGKGTTFYITLPKA